MGLTELLIGGSALAVGLEILPQVARHPFCLEHGCKSEHSIQTTNVLFCGGCAKYPSDISSFSGLTAPHILRTDSTASSNILKLENHVLQLQPKKFGSYSDADGAIVPPNTSSLAHDIMQQCELINERTANLRPASELGGISRAQLAHVFLIPIENLHGLSKVQLTLGDAFGDQKHLYGVIEWNLNQIFKEVDNPGSSQANIIKRAFSLSSSKSFLIIKIPFSKTLADISESRSYGVADALPKQISDQASMELLRYTRSSALKRNPLSGLKWWLTCQGNALTEKRISALDKYRSFNDISQDMRNLISMWRKLAEKQDPENVSQAVVRKRNFILSRAFQIVTTNLRNRSSYGYASKISEECAPYGATFLHAFVTTTQSLP